MGQSSLGAFEWKTNLSLKLFLLNLIAAVWGCFGWRSVERVISHVRVVMQGYRLGSFISQLVFIPQIQNDIAYQFFDENIKKTTEISRNRGTLRISQGPIVIHVYTQSGLYINYQPLSGWQHFHHMVPLYVGLQILSPNSTPDITWSDPTRELGPVILHSFIKQPDFLVLINHNWNDAVSRLIFHWWKQKNS